LLVWAPFMMQTLLRRVGSRSPRNWWPYPPSGIPREELRRRMVIDTTGLTH